MSMTNFQSPRRSSHRTPHSVMIVDLPKPRLTARLYFLTWRLGRSLRLSMRAISSFLLRAGRDREVVLESSSPRNMEKRLGLGSDGLV